MSSVAQAAQRGLSEELGIKASVRFLAKIENRAHPATENMIGELFVGYHDGPYHLQEAELARIELMTVAELDFIHRRYPYLICDNFKASIDAYLANADVFTQKLANDEMTMYKKDKPQLS